MELREALEGAVAEAETAAAAEAASAAPTESPPAAEPAGDPPAASEKPPAGEPPADEPKSGESPADEPKPADEPPAGEKTPKQAAEEARLHRIDRAPQSWKKEAKGEWAALPLQARQEIHKREAEISRALSSAAPDKQLAEQFRNTVTPYMARVKVMGVNPVEAVDRLFKADHILSSAPPRDKAAYMAKLIMEYGVSVEELDSALAPLVNGRAAGAPAGAPAAPDISAIVQQQLQQALAPIMQREKDQQQRAAQEITQTIEQMAVDPKYPFFDDVRDDMADLIDIAARRGVVLSMDEAYSRATRMNPDTYGQLERQSSMSNATAQHQAALRAKNAASSITGAPAGGGGQSNTGDGSLRGAIEAAFGGMRL